jgi:hypothetical protein
LAIAATWRDGSSGGAEAEAGGANAANDAAMRRI